MFWWSLPAGLSWCGSCGCISLSEVDEMEIFLDYGKSSCLDVFIWAVVVYQFCKEISLLFVCVCVCVCVCVKRGLSRSHHWKSLTLLTISHSFHSLGPLSHSNGLGSPSFLFFFKNRLSCRYLLNHANSFFPSPQISAWMRTRPLGEKKKFPWGYLW